MKRIAMNIILVAVLTYLVGQLLGWLAIPVVALIVSFGARQLDLHAWEVGTGAALAWAIGLMRVVASGAISGLLRAMGGIFHVPGFMMVLITLLLAFGLAWSAGAIVITMVRRERT